MATKAVNFNLPELPDGSIWPFGLIGKGNCLKSSGFRVRLPEGPPLAKADSVQG